MRRSYSFGRVVSLSCLALSCLALWCLALFLLDPIAAQAQSKPGNLDEKSSAVITRLDGLQELPVEGWRTHIGDLPHGESPTLDDSSWPVIQDKQDFSNDAVWFRRTIEVPRTLNGYDLTGARIWFQFHAEANGPMPQIIYFNGRRVALGEDLEPIVLFDLARPGDRILVAIKLLRTVDKKRFDHATTRIDFVDSRPSPRDLVSEARAAALVLPSLTPADNGAADLKQVDVALSKVDLTALDHADQQGFDASLRAAQAELQKLRPVLDEVSIHLTGNSHIDAAWLWPSSETVDVVRRTFSTALQLMQEYPDYTYTQSAAAYSDWMCDKYPDMCREMQQRVKDGRWEMVGGMWVEPDLNMPDGESLVRQLLIGKRKFKEQFGVDIRIGWNPDSFGYNWQLPQIYKKSGIDYFVTQKMAWNDTNQLPLKLFWWQAPDGSRVLTYFPHDYGNDIEPLRLAGDIARARELNPGTFEIFHLYGIGDHGGGPTRAMLDSGIHWTSSDVVFPKANFGIAQAFFSDIETRLDTAHAPIWNYSNLAAKTTTLPPAPEGQVSIPVWNDELYFEYHRGVMTTQANHKRSMREGEEQLLNAEKFSSLAWLTGRDYPQKPLNEAWKKVLFNQFHDLAAGSGIAVIYRDAQKDYAQVRWAADEAQGDALKALASHVDTATIKNSSFELGNVVPVLIMNPLAWSRSDLVEAEIQLPQHFRGLTVESADGLFLPSQILSFDPQTHAARLLIKTHDVPSLGYEVVHVRGVPPDSLTFPLFLKASATTLENNLLRVSVDQNTGCITSLFDKKANFEAIAKGGCGNQLQTFKDTPKDYDAWNIDPGTLDKFTSIDKADSVELISKGPLRATIRVTHTWQSSKFVQDISLDADSPQLEVANDIDWHETHVLLKVAFPLAASSGMARYEIPYGSIDRPTTRNNSVEQAKFEVPALRWADLGDGLHGFSLINESKYGYDAKDNVLRLSLLRSPTWPDPDADRGHHHFRYWLYPHSGDWKSALTVHHGYETNYPLIANQVESHTGAWPAEHSFVSVAPENVILTAVKKAEDSDALLFRVYESAGMNATVTVTIPPGSSSATLTNLMEQPEGSAIGVSRDKISFPIHPWEIQTVRVDYAHPAQTTTAAK